MSGFDGDLPSYRSRLYAAYRTTQSGNEPASGETFAARRAWWQAHVDPLMPSDRSASILDGACGSGALVWHLRNCGFSDVEGIDVSAEEVEAAMELGLPVRRAELGEELTARPAALDVIVLRDVIEHFTKDEVLPLLDLVYRALRPGGTLIIQVPNGDSPFFGRIRYGDFTHENAFTTRSLRQILLATRFTAPRFVSVGPVATSPRSRARRLAWSMVERLYKALVLIEFGEKPEVVSQVVIVSATRPK